MHWVVHHEVTVVVVSGLLVVLLFWIGPRLMMRSRFCGDIGQQPAELQFVGGGYLRSRWGWWLLGGSWPLVRFEVLPWGVRVGPADHWMLLWMPMIELRWDEIASTRVSGFWGVSMRTRIPSPAWVCFSERGKTDRVITALKDHGIEIG